jgi:peptidyl-prolyl cis-trans isomerase SurA
MRRLLCVLLLLCAGRAEIIDRVAVVVGNRVITESEILREVRLTAFLNGAPLDFSSASKRKTAERLVEQRLIGNEMDSSLYPMPEPESVDQMAKDLQTRFPNRERYEQELQRAGITEEDLKAHLRRQLITLRFLEFRFRPGIQVGEDEVNKYFNERLAPELKKAHPGMEFALDDYRDQVEQALIGELVDKASDTWLKGARDRTRIEFRDAAFAPQPPRQETTQ